MQTINYNFDLDLSRYITLNYEAIETIIDSIGGVDIYVGENQVPHIAEVDHSGWQTLTGAQAVGFTCSVIQIVIMDEWQDSKQSHNCCLF